MLDAKTTILVVEDSPEDFEATQRGFRRAGLRNVIVHCEDGDEALDYLHQRGGYAAADAAPRPAVVLLDLNLPGTDGLRMSSEFARRNPWVAWIFARRGNRGNFLGTDHVPRFRLGLQHQANFIDGRRVAGVLRRHQVFCQENVQIGHGHANFAFVARHPAEQFVQQIQKFERQFVGAGGFLALSP